MAMNKAITRFLQELHASLSTENGGEVANYIPELARANPDLFGIALVTVDGHVHQVGDSGKPFTIQSISKAFTYGLALQDRGIEAVSRKIDVEPSGESFNSISLESHTGRPRNPMINAGAMVATSLVHGDTTQAKSERILEKFSEFAACNLSVDEEVFRSEKETGHRNRAIANLLRNYEILEEDPEQPLEAYFRQCSILVTAQDLAVMGATLANKGVNPITSVPVLDEGLVPSVLAVMSSCGMYDYSGNWIRSVGMPAKSGVGGGIMAVLPGQFGLAIYSPRLDAKGNSVRGIKVCEAVSNNYDVHMFNSARHTTSNTLKALYTLGDVSSRFERDAAENRFLREAGHGVLVCELTGEQSFITTESLSSRLLRDMKSLDILVLDFQQMTGSDHASARVMAELLNELLNQGKQLYVSGTSDKYDFHRKLALAGMPWRHSDLFEFRSLEEALQACEDQLLAEEFEHFSADLRVPLSRQPLLEGLTGLELNWLRKLMTLEFFEGGAMLCRSGELSSMVYLIERGKVDVMLADKVDSHVLQHHKPKVASFCSGGMVGEAAFFDHAPRTADVVAVGPVEAWSLEPERMMTVSEDDISAQVQVKIFHNLARISFDRLRNINRMVMTLHH